MKHVPCLWLVMGALAAGCGKNDPPKPAAAPVSAAPVSMPSLQAGAAAAAPPGQGAATAPPATPAPPVVDFAATRPVNEKGDPMSDLELLNRALFHYNEARATGTTTGGGQLRTYKTEAEQMAAEAAQKKSLGPATDLSELVKAGIIKAVPVAPAGKKYAIDPQTHKAVLVNGP